MPLSENDRTYRLWGLPAGITIEGSELILQNFFDSDGNTTEPTVHSLGLDPYTFGRNVEVVATVTFSRIPRALLDGNRWHLKKQLPYQGAILKLSLSIDTTFIGFTPLNDVKDDEDHKIDCIAVSGLSSHPFGSWKHRGGQFMWLRDSLACQSSGVRVLLYGYDTSLIKSESFQDIDDIGNKLGDFIRRIRLPRTGEINFEPRPIVFIAHSLGGLVVKEAICRMALADWVNAQCVYGMIFFGVPNRGIRISHWLPMVNNQPNESLIRNLAPDSHYLRNLQERYCQVFRFPSSRVVSVYETLKSKTAKEESPGNWKLTGQSEVLVPRDSAQDSCPPGLIHNYVSMNQNHADLPKFSEPRDSDYQLLKGHIEDMWRDAVINVQLRFGTEGFFTRGLDPPRLTPQHLGSKVSANVPSTDQGQSPVPGQLRSHYGNIPWDYRPVAAREEPPIGVNLSPMIPSANSTVDQRASPHANQIQNDYFTSADALPRYGYEVPLAPGKEEKNRQAFQPTSVRPLVPDLTFDKSDWKPPSPTERNLRTADAQAAEKIESDLELAQHLADSLGKNISIMCLRCNKTFTSRDAILAHLKISGHYKEDEGDSTTLHSATSHENLDVDNLLLHRVLRIEAKDEERLNPLHSAATDGRLEEAKLLLNQGARIELHDASNRTPLHCAVEKGHLERGAKTDAKNDQNNTSLHFAAKNGYLVLANLLLDSGAGIEAKDRMGHTPLHNATYYGHLDVAKLLLDQGADIEAKMSDNCTPLHRAAQKGHLEVVSLLLERGAKVEAKIDNYCTSLHLAAKHGYVEVANLLLDSGAGIQAKDTGSWTPLHSATYYGHIDVVKLLLDHRADIEANTSDNCTPLHCVAQKGHLEVVSLLLERGAKVEAKNGDHCTSLHLAARHGHVEVANLLLNSGAGIQAKDIRSWTPLHYAAGHGSLDVVKLLVDRGANIEARNNVGRAPHHYAKENGHWEIVRFLKMRTRKPDRNLFASIFSSRPKPDHKN